MRGKPARATTSRTQLLALMVGLASLLVQLGCGTAASPTATKPLATGTVRPEAVAGPRRAALRGASSEVSPTVAAGTPAPAATGTAAGGARPPAVTATRQVTPPGTPATIGRAGSPLLASEPTATPTIALTPLPGAPGSPGSPPLFAGKGDPLPAGTLVPATTVAAATSTPRAQPAPTTPRATTTPRAATPTRSASSARTPPPAPRAGTERSTPSPSGDASQRATPTPRSSPAATGSPTIAGSPTPTLPPLGDTGTLARVATTLAKTKSFRVAETYRAGAEGFALTSERLFERVEPDRWRWLVRETRALLAPDRPDRPLFSSVSTLEAIGVGADVWVRREGGWTKVATPAAAPLRTPAGFALELPLESILAFAGSPSGALGGRVDTAPAGPCERWDRVLGEDQAASLCIGLRDGRPYRFVHATRDTLLQRDLFDFDQPIEIMPPM